MNPTADSLPPAPAPAPGSTAPGSTPARTARRSRSSPAPDPGSAPGNAAPQVQETSIPVVSGEILNRELSWLQFNQRVLHEAIDSRTPLLERVRFLSIFNSNLDEFIMKRVGGLKRQIAAGVTTRFPDGHSPRELLDAIRKFVLEMLQAQADVFHREILPALSEHGVFLLSWSDLTPADRDFCRAYFRANLFPVLTPLAVDPGHPFPFISNLSTSLGVTLRNPTTDAPASPAVPGDSLTAPFARVKVPPMLPPWVRLPQPAPSDLSATTGSTSGGVTSGGDSPPYRFVRLRDIIEANLGDLFEGMVLEEIEPFRVTRNADVERDEEDAEDLLELIEQELRDRRFAQAVRLEVGAAPSPVITRYLMQELQLEPADVYEMPAELDYTTLNMIAGLNLPKLKDEPWVPVLPPRLADEEADIFSLIRQGDLLVHHPYESFSASVERFIRAAANDPKVMAIKMTLYRTSHDSPFIPELIRAAETGKQVVCLVELKARFDEEQNIRVAQALERAGVHVVYGIMGLKTHTKTSLVVRQEADGVRAYVHIGTGNYNSKTAQLYTDLGLFTCHPGVTSDVVNLFHYLTGRSLKQDFNHLLIAPLNMRRRFVEMIERETAHAAAWRARGADPADPDRPRIVAKMNSLEDHALCRKLYEAAQAGVRIQLIVRGFCCIRPGLPGLSENISVQSVIGRYLEHSRIFHFHNAGRPEYYIGSADWMYRNLYYRVECITPILDPALQQRLQQVLDIMLSDRRQAWDMQPDGVYVQRTPDPSQPAATPGSNLGTHQRLMALARQEAHAPLHHNHLAGANHNHAHIPDRDI